MMQKLISKLRDYFGFSQKQIRGLLLLFPLCLILPITSLISSHLLSAKKKSNTILLLTDNDRLSYLDSLFDKSASPNLYTFDPHTATEEDWKNFGLPEYMAKRIVNYTEKGGKFRKKEDLKKIYGFKEEDYIKLEPYIQINAKATAQFQSSNKPIYYNFDPNTATEADWQSLGLPEYMAKRIVNYTEKGGKFRKKEDLKNIYGFKDEDYTRLAPYMHINDMQNNEDTKEFAIEYFNFDPNTATEADWKQLGLPEFMAKRIVNYTEKGGEFRKKEDLKNIYGFKDEDYVRLEPYIRISEKETVAPKETPKKDFFDLNTADATTLQQIRGIGAVLSKRIIEYRENLGGFNSFEQLTDIYGLDAEVIDKIKAQTHLEKPILRKIKINQVDETKLKAHPYFKNYKQRQALFAYRNNHGKIRSATDFQNVGVWTKEELKKILPYLAYD
ncbi:MAG: helix-hairpin-helix domain-containing protein [Bernardetiaceae bacterium]|nr:helix-hairpin-helix domain-containing protein [Bernardetiaceae bacterium]